jgi:hypothetical protein
MIPHFPFRRGYADSRAANRERVNPSVLDHLAPRVFLPLPLLVVGCNDGFRSGVRIGRNTRSIPVDSAEPLGPDGQGSLHAILEGGTLSELRWPDFNDYREDVARFYEASGDALP